MENKTIMKQKNYFIALLCLLLVISIIVSCFLGSATVRFQDFWSILGENRITKTGYILKYIRIPRIFAGVIAGIGLATSGVIIQTIFHNPMAGPNIIGVNSGAGFFLILCYLLFPDLYQFLPFAAFLGALIAVMLIYVLGFRCGASKYTLILAGIAINCIFNSATDTLYLINDDYIIGSKMFKIGSFSTIQIPILIIAGCIIFVCFLLTLLFHNQLELLSLGDSTAKSLGLNVKRYRMLFLFLAAVLAGASVSFSGLIGFVGLIVPHIARMLVGDESKHLILTSALLGAFLLNVCDTLGRTLFQPYEIPVGIFLAFLGAPFFIYLLLVQRRKRYD